MKMKMKMEDDVYYGQLTQHTIHWKSIISLQVIRIILKQLNLIYFKFFFFFLFIVDGYLSFEFIMSICKNNHMKLLYVINGFAINVLFLVFPLFDSNVSWNFFVSFRMVFVLLAILIKINFNSLRHGHNMKTKDD